MSSEDVNIFSVFVSAFPPLQNIFLFFEQCNTFNNINKYALKSVAPIPSYVLPKHLR